MNFDYNDLLDELMNGASEDALAKSFTDALNKAIQKRKEENEKEKFLKEKDAATAALLAAQAEYMEKYYPKTAKTAKYGDITVEEFYKAMETLEKLQDGIASLTQALAGPEEEKNGDLDELEKFLREMKW